MGLINCIDCNKSISDKAESCPNCGCPAWAMKEGLNPCSQCNAPLKPKAIKCENCQNLYVIKDPKTGGHRKAYKWEIEQILPSKQHSKVVQVPPPEKKNSLNHKEEIHQEVSKPALLEETQETVPSRPAKEVLNDIQLSGSQKAGVKEKAMLVIFPLAIMTGLLLWGYAQSPDGREKARLNWVKTNQDQIQEGTLIPKRYTNKTSRIYNKPEGRVRFVLREGSRVYAYDKIGKWVRISKSGERSHWIQERDLRRTGGGEQARLEWVKANKAKIQENTDKPAQYTNQTTRIYDKPEGSVRYTLGKGSRLYAYEKIGEWVRVSKSGELTNWVMESDISETAQQEQVARQNPIKKTVESAERKSTKPVGVDLIDGWETIPMNYCTTCTQGYQAVGVWNKGKGLVEMIVAARDSKGRFYSGRKYDCGASPQVAYYNSASDTLGGVWSSSDVNRRRLSIRGASTNAPVKDLGVYACRTAGY